MQVLVLVAPRNGVGRTTLVHRLAPQVRRSGTGPVVLLDADPRGDLFQKCAEKAQADLIVVPWDESCTGPQFQQLKGKSGGLIIVDAPLPEARKALNQTLSIADLIVVMVRPREDDFAQLGGLVDVVEATAKPFFFVVNRAKRHGNMAAATAIALAQYGTVCPVILPEDERVAPSLRAKVFRKTRRTDAQLKREQFWTYLSGRLEALRGEAGTPAGEELADGRQERRQFPRHSYDIGATFTWERKVFPCRIQNISAGGLSFTTDTPVPLGSRLKIHIPYLGEFSAVSVHRDSTSVGLGFIIDEWQQAGLVRDLTGLVGAGRGVAKQAGGSRESREAAAQRDKGERAGAPEDKAKGSKIRKRA